MIKKEKPELINKLRISCLLENKNLIYDKICLINKRGQKWL